MPSITNEPPKSMRGGQQRWSGKTGLECFRASVYNLITKTSAECARLKRAVLVGGHLARLAIPKDCEPGRQRGEDVAALLIFVGLPILNTCHWSFDIFHFSSFFICHLLNLSS